MKLQKLTIKELQHLISLLYALGEEELSKPEDQCSQDIVEACSNPKQSSTGLPVGECYPERSVGSPAEPVKRILYSVKVPRACPWVSILIDVLVKRYG